MHYRKLLCAIVSLLMIAVPAAAMTVTMSVSPPPPGDIVIGVDAEDDLGCYLCSHGSSEVLDLGQTFRTSSPFTVAKITIKVRALTGETPGESVTLFFGTFSDQEDYSMDEVLGAEIVDLPSALPVGEVRYLTFDMADIQLDADRQYGFRLAFTGGGCVKNARLDLLHVGTDAYPEGLAVETGGTVPSPLAFDLVFFIHRTSVIFADGFESGDTSMWSVDF